MSAVATGTAPRRSTGLRVVRTLCVRLAVALGTLLLISVITFAATNAVPSDPARVALGKLASPAELAEYRKSEGLDRPVVPRYFEWLGRYVQGDWGHSVLANQLSVRSEVVPRMIRTLILGGVSLIFALAFAFMLGAYTGRRSGGPADFVVSGVTLIFNATPEFVTALLVVVVFAVKLDWLPIESASGILYGSGPCDTVSAYIAPVVTLVLVLTPYMTRMVRDERARGAAAAADAQLGAAGPAQRHRDVEARRPERSAAGHHGRRAHLRRHPRRASWSSRASSPSRASATCSSSSVLGKDLPDGAGGRAARRRGLRAREPARRRRCSCCSTRASGHGR